MTSDDKRMRAKATWYAIRLIQDHIATRWTTNRSPLKRELLKVVESLEGMEDNIWKQLRDELRYVSRSKKRHSSSRVGHE